MSAALATSATLLAFAFWVRLSTTPHIELLLTRDTAKGNTVTFLLRSPSVFDEDETMKKYIRDGKARIVKGDALQKEDVQRGWAEAAKPAYEGDQQSVDILLFTLGNLTLFPLQPMTLILES